MADVADQATSCIDESLQDYPVQAGEGQDGDKEAKGATRQHPLECRDEAVEKRRGAAYKQGQ